MLLHCAGFLDLYVPGAVVADDGVYVLETRKEANFNLTCTSSKFNHSWHFEPEDNFTELKVSCYIRVMVQ